MNGGITGSRLWPGRNSSGFCGLKPPNAFKFTPKTGVVYLSSARLLRRSSLQLPDSTLQRLSPENGIEYPNQATVSQLELVGDDITPEQHTEWDEKLKERYSKSTMIPLDCLLAAIVDKCDKMNRALEYVSMADQFIQSHPEVEKELENAWNMKQFKRICLIKILRRKEGPKRIHFMRHGEARHNFETYYFERDASHMVDPRLTSRGREQVQKWREASYDKTFSDWRDILIVVSPLSRAIETALIAFEPLLNAKGTFDIPTKAILLPHIQEASDYVCDTPLPLADIQARLPNLTDIFDCSLLSWANNRGEFADDEYTREKRLAWVRKWLFDHPWDEIVVVGHAACLEWLLKIPLTAPQWPQAEMRTYEFQIPEEISRLAPAEVATHTEGESQIAM